MKRPQRMPSLLGAGALLAAVSMLAGCGGSSGSSADPNSNNPQAPADAGSSDPYILGTTDPITSLDPAGAYDIGSWNIQYSVFQQLMVVPEGSSQPEGDAAKSCTYDNPKTLTCKLQPGLKFSNGDALTSSDVKYSFQRNLEIADPNGASTLLGSISNGDDKSPGLAPGAITTPDDTTVVFHLNSADLTFIKVLTTAAASIVDEDVYPETKLQDQSQIIGSGPYDIKQYVPDQQVVLESNPNYVGTRAGKAPQVVVSLYSDASTLKNDIQTGQINVAWRTLSPTDLNDLKSASDVSVLSGKGSEFRYWVWDLNNATPKQLAVRQAAAYLINRDEITKDAYDGTVTPAYSIVPPGFPGQTDSFKTMYGSTPNPTKAKQVLQQAGIKTPVDITIGYPPDHYGPNSVDEANTLKGDLEKDGLFSVKIQDAEWTQYQNLYKQGAYDLYLLGWYPDFLDADNYLTPFLRDGGFFANGYSNKQVNSLLTKELGDTNQASRAKIFGQLQNITARDVPIIPSWNGKNTAVATTDMKGVEETLDPTYIFRMWTVGD